MADQAIQFSQGAGGLYARMAEGPSVGGHSTLHPYHLSLDGGPSWVVARVPISSADLTLGMDITAAPGSGEYAMIDDLFVSVDRAMLITVVEQTSGDVITGVYLPTNGQWSCTRRDGIRAKVADKKLRLVASIAGNVIGDCNSHSSSL